MSRCRRPRARQVGEEEPQYGSGQVIITKGTPPSCACALTTTWPTPLARFSLHSHHTAASITKRHLYTLRVGFSPLHWTLLRATAMFTAPHSHTRRITHLRSPTDPLAGAQHTGVPSSRRPPAPAHDYHINLHVTPLHFIHCFSYHDSQIQHNHLPR